jgi:hypothetical protein
MVDGFSLGEGVSLSRLFDRMSPKESGDGHLILAL